MYCKYCLGRCVFWGGLQPPIVEPAQCSCGCHAKDKARLGECYPHGHCEHIPLFTNDDRRFIDSTESEFLRLGGDVHSIIYRLHPCCKCAMQCTWLDLPILLQLLLDLLQNKAKEPPETNAEVTA